ncbi:MAG: RidA family protein [Bacteroidia bacterium]|nr:RidA family protein [Bacteroidia bacterium]
MKEAIKSKNAPAPIGPYSQAILSDGTLYCSGQIALTADGKMRMDNIIEETQQVMMNIGEVLKAANMDYADIIKTSIFLKDMGHFTQVNEVYGAFLKDPFPARETVQVAKLPKDVNVEISVIAKRS